MSSEKKINILHLIWPPVIIAAIIFYLSCLIPPRDIPEIDFKFPIETDKIVHFLMYFGLAGIASLNYVYRNNGRIIILKMLLFAVLLPILYGGLMEILQESYFDRQGDWWDFLANSLGALSTIPFSLWLRKHLLRKEQMKLNLEI